MPELPEVETLAAQLRAAFAGRGFSRAVVRRADVINVTAEELDARLAGKRLHTVSRRGKFLAFHFENGSTLWFHLGMTGQLLQDPRGEWDAHTHVVLEFTPQARLVFRDIRRFGGVLLTPVPKGVEMLGPEPFEIEAGAFAGIFRRRKARIKNLLLNQRLVAGIGNIYADESLHRAGIDPRRRAWRVTLPRLAALHCAVVEVLKEAIAHGGSSIDDYRHADGARGGFQERHRVYGKAGRPCKTCGEAIRRIQLSGRSSFFCPKCQS